MKKKLTLRIDDNLIEFAKKYSAKTGKSVSRIVADLFEIIRNEKIGRSRPLSPAVQSLKKGVKIRFFRQASIFELAVFTE